MRGDLFADNAPADVIVDANPGRRRSRIKLSYNEYLRLCRAVRMRDNNRCRCCKSRNQLHGHHIVFRSQGGDDADWNLITLCSHCHDGIHKPHPRSGACLILMRHDGEEGLIDANGPVKFFYANGWTPRRTVS